MSPNAIQARERHGKATIAQRCAAISPMPSAIQAPMSPGLNFQLHIPPDVAFFVGWVPIIPVMVGNAPLSEKSGYKFERRITAYFQGN
jgi:hypothetical protein